MKLRELASLQAAEPRLGKIVDYCREGTGPVELEIRRILDDYEWENDVLLYCRYHRPNRLGIPRRIHEKLLRHYHQELGHFSTHKVYPVLRELFYWGNMYPEQ